MDSSLCNRDGLLLHGFVNSDLVLHVHLVELIDAADAMVGKHKGSSLDAEFTGLVVLPHGSGQTSGVGSFA